MKKIKINFWKCNDCEFQTTIKKDADQHGLPYMQMEKGEMKLHKAHKIENLRGKIIAR